ncbi:MAG: hypothetical protein MUP81_01880 [Dehalococcoidia bacterium]|nr:hypothetical protein [Dehalococcoidia bacterium]
MNESGKWLVSVLIMSAVDFLTDCRKVQTMGILDEISRDELYKKLRIVKQALARLEDLEDVGK